ncbi:hypothetical protein BAZ10_15080 [Elizabethkingia occulta]|uniref:Uncharacterized protein n=1 Tax=Elizabethkingia occulta TaxID=1867263 RepID=A0A1T3MTS2_9FLAO|nr:hypothetical protein BB020_12095 [Elizabethkingia occulta]OPC67916.1 hypothetical protein BAZ10_15080 [Elizabethkingia occulta]
MKILKFISIISFLLTTGVNEKAMPNIMVMLISIYLYISELSVSHTSKETFWFIIMILIIAVLIIFYKCKAYKDRYILILCFISLCMATILFSKILEDYKPTVTFIITSGIFIISSLALIIWNFKPLKKE